MQIRGKCSNMYSRNRQGMFTDHRFLLSSKENFSAFQFSHVHFRKRGPLDEKIKLIVCLLISCLCVHVNGPENVAYKDDQLRHSVKETDLWEGKIDMFIYGKKNEQGKSRDLHDE